VTVILRNHPILLKSLTNRLFVIVQKNFFEGDSSYSAKNGIIVFVYTRAQE